MLKAVGALCVIAAAGSYGVVVARDYARRPRELREARAALSMLETEIAYGATPLPEALETVGRRCDGALARFFTGAAEALAVRDGTTAGEAWEHSLARYSAHAPLRPEDLAALGSLGAVLGNSDREDQTRHLRLAGERLKILAARADDEARRNVRLWRYLGFLAGAAVALVIC
ncbi:MAG: stage III sporulation protein AB [Thermoanaerobacterales bacterium]|nr:stage III sporulation protein AB [Bacillota bacterium]MDI6906758.1 stage III sporulation protein AB [Thermoanaerobacterales bacterium]